jgi:hypothetical protein
LIKPQLPVIYFLIYIIIVLSPNLEPPPQGNLLIHNLERIRMRSLYKRFEKLRASNDLTQMVTTIPEFFKD